MDPARLQALLNPFATTLSPALLEDISIYIDLLLRWNARMNLTAIRDEENIVTRHFGESLFAAQHIFPPNHQRPETNDAVDVGSGAGFPGLPIKLWKPSLHLTLVESNRRKATFLREVIRALALSSVEVFADRAENFPAASCDLVTLRAVERFDQVLPLAARLTRPSGRLAFLIGQAQLDVARTLPGWHWDQPVPIPRSAKRVLLVAHREGPSL